MSFKLPEQRWNAKPRTRWQAAAFLIETMMLLLFMSISLATLTSLFVESVERSATSSDLSQAVALATSAAERFAADPTAEQATSAKDGLVVSCDVTPEAREAGTLYRAVIHVRKMDGGAGGAGTTVYELSTAQYRSGV